MSDLPGIIDTPLVLATEGPTTMTAAAHPAKPALPASAAALRAAFERTARERPELADRLPWSIFTDPDELARFQRLDAEAARVRQGLRSGQTLEELDLIDGGLQRILEERGLR